MKKRFLELLCMLILVAILASSYTYDSKTEFSIDGVALGMTREEVQASRGDEAFKHKFGEPSEFYPLIPIRESEETWLYDFGDWVLFDEGRVKMIVGDRLEANGEAVDKANLKSELGEPTHIDKLEDSTVYSYPNLKVYLGGHQDLGFVLGQSLESRGQELDAYIQEARAHIQERSEL